MTHTIPVGTIVHVTWGYDQTNQNYYHVDRVTPHKVELRPIGQTRVDDWHVEPDATITRDWDVLLGIDRDDAKRTRLCTVRPDGTVKVGRHSAFVWGGHANHQTPWWAGR